MRRMKYIVCESVAMARTAPADWMTLTPTLTLASIHCAVVPPTSQH